jgi:hypothetical protein
MPAAVATLLAQPKSDDQRLSGNLRRACCRLAAACFAANAESQVLGAVTSLEMLLSPDGDFQRLEKRCAEIVADMDEGASLLRSLLKARHEHVHQGRDVDPSVGRQAILVLMQIMERLARSQNVITSQGQLCSYLDARIAAKRLKSRFPGPTAQLPSLDSAPWDQVTPPGL